MNNDFLSTNERYRLLMLGSGRVGKTSLINRYLNNTFSDRYKETVEDIFARNFHIKGALLPLDIYDTNFYYPDMRRVSMVSANAFVLIFAVDNVSSFKDVTDLVQEVADRRPTDLVDLPMVLVGNKCDAPNKKIYPETVYAWLNHLTIRKKIPYFETSAKTGENIVAVFKSLLDQSGFPQHADKSNLLGPHQQYYECPSPRIPSPRRSQQRSPCRNKNQGDRSDEDEVGTPPRSPTVSTANEQRIARLTRTLSRKEKPVTTPLRNTPGANGDHKQSGVTRHGSLMRKTHRPSLKVKHAPHDEPDESDCKIS